MKLSLMAATAILSSSFLSVPAYAGPDDNIPLDSVNDTTGMTPQQVCEAVLRPNDPNSQFHTAPTDQVDNVVFSQSVVQDSTPFAQQGTGTPTYSGYGNFDSNYHRNGGSPNIWTGADANIANYPSSDLFFHTTVTQTLGSTFGCSVWKDPGGSEHGPGPIYPPGLQSSGHSSVTGTTSFAGDDVVDHNGGPYSTGGAYHDANVLICISPNNVTKGKPGTWTGKHGFTAAGCYGINQSLLNPVPSGNNPL